MIFALSAGVLGAAVGGAVDMSRLYTARERLQLVTDAAALAGKHAEVEHIRRNGRLGSRAAGEDAAEVYFTGNRSSVDGFVNGANMVPAWDADDGALRVNATGEVEMLFGGLFGVDTVDLNVTAAATAGLGVPTEVAMVLDTTASMFQRDGRPETRFQLLRQAAVRFANDMFDAASLQEDRLRVAVIPWTTTVNILGPAPRAWSPGGSGVAVTADAGSRQLVAAPIARDSNVVESAASRTSMFAPVEWRGCISGQRESLDTTDAVMTGMQWNVLNVASQPLTLTQREGVNVSVPRTTCTGACGGSPPAPPPPPASPPPPTSPPPPSPPPPPPPPPPPSTQGFFTRMPGEPPRAFAALSGSGSLLQAACTCTTTNVNQVQCLAGGRSVVGLNCTQDDSNGTRNVFFGADTACHLNGCRVPFPSVNTTTLRACVADPNEIAWNNANSRWCSWVPRTTWTQFDAIVGPNLNCPMPMLGLSGDRTQVMEALNRLSPTPGGTHADVGLRWGLRALSPRTEWANFFGLSGGSTPAPGPYGTPEVRKVMMLITDGQNQQAVDFPGYWGCSEAGAPGCTGSPNRTELDTRMLNWCRAIREDYDITLYTVAVNVNDATAVSLLRDCAGSQENAFSVDASGLTPLLEALAARESRVRLKN